MQKICFSIYLRKIRQKELVQEMLLNMLGSRRVRWKEVENLVFLAPTFLVTLLIITYF